MSYTYLTSIRMVFKFTLTQTVNNNQTPENIGLKERKNLWNIWFTCVFVSLYAPINDGSPRITINDNALILKPIRSATDASF